MSIVKKHSSKRHITGNLKIKTMGFTELELKFIRSAFIQSCSDREFATEGSDKEKFEKCYQDIMKKFEIEFERIEEEKYKGNGKQRK